MMPNKPDMSNPANMRGGADISVKSSSSSDGDKQDFTIIGLHDEKEIQEQEYTERCTSRDHGAKTTDTSTSHPGRRTSPVPALASSNASIPTTALNESSASYAVGASSSDDILSMNSTTSSINRSFTILNSLDLSVKSGRSDVPDFFSGAGLYAKEWSQDEKDNLVAFANKYIIRDGGSRSTPNQHDDSPKKM